MPDLGAFEMYHDTAPTSISILVEHTLTLSVNSPALILPKNSGISMAKISAKICQTWRNISQNWLKREVFVSQRRMALGGSRYYRDTHTRPMPILIRLSNVSRYLQVAEVSGPYSRRVDFVTPFFTDVDFVVDFAVHLSGIILSFIYRDGGSQEIHREIHRENPHKIHDKIRSLRLKIHYDKCSAEGQS